MQMATPSTPALRAHIGEFLQMGAITKSSTPRVLQQESAELAIVSRTLGSDFQLAQLKHSQAQAYLLLRFLATWFVKTTL